ncbi:hypothetical protein G7054_g10980 [Neopestalotiopsis clavispora]|nr:hypothetical protein G7054_g10980 [Neopestalotiopsis clavispora]
MSFDQAPRNVRQELLNDVRNAIWACRRGEDACAIVCFSDLKDVYNGRLQDIQTIARLTTEQATEVHTHMLKLFSFFVILPAPLEWFDLFQSLFFAETPHSQFKDEQMPLPEALATNLKLEPFLYRWPEQYLFIPAVIKFGNDKPQLIANKRIRLPYLESLGKYDGGFGGVKCWMLAPEYIDNGKTQYKEPVAVAVKTFKPKPRGPKEVKNMRTLKESLTRSKGLSLHKAILELANGEIKIFLPRAEHGSLDTFLAGGKAPPRWNRYTYDLAAEFPHALECNDRLATALLEQCVSVADALKFLHGGFPSKLGHVECAHMDLKPDNILIFQGGKESMVGTWKIADFGISVIKNSTDPVDFAGTVGDLFHKHTMDTEARREQGAYTPPEVHSITGHDSRRVGRRVDVWAFGAIFAEVLAFSLGHATEVARLTDIRRARVSVVADDYFYSQKPLALLAVPGQQTGELQFELKPGVQNWLFECERKWSDDRPYVKDWVRCISSALSVDKEQRPEATQLLRDVVLVHTSAFNIVGDDLPSQATDETYRPDTATTISTFTTTSEAYSHQSSDILNIDFDAHDIKLVWSPPGKLPTIAEPQRSISIDGFSEPSIQTANILRIDRVQGRPPAAKDVPAFDNVTKFSGKHNTGKVTAVAIDDERIASLSQKGLRVFRVDRSGGFRITAEQPENLLSLQEGVVSRYERLSISGIYLVVWGIDDLTQVSLAHAAFSHFLTDQVNLALLICVQWFSLGTKSSHTE